MENTRTCVDCRKEKLLTDFGMSFAGVPKLNKPDYAERNPWGVRKNRCKACYAARERAQRKVEFLEAYGGRCACCGEPDHRFLTLDHIQNDGNVHREAYKCHQIYALAKKEGYPLGRYQILCFNCNSGRACNGGVCPHIDLVNAEESWRRLKSKIGIVSQKFVRQNPITQFKSGFDERRMQLNRRALKRCPYCDGEFGTHELTRHKREVHREQIAARRLEVLANGRKVRLEPR